MKKFIVRALLFIGLGFYQAHAADVDIFKIFKGLSNTFDSLSAKKGLLADVDEILSNVSKFKAFSSCQARALASGKPYRLLVQTIQPKKPDGTPDKDKPVIKINCGDYSIPLDAIQLMLDLMNNKVIGSEKAPGLFSSIIQILEGAGFEKIEEIKDTVKEIQTLLKAFQDVLDWLKKNLKVDPNEKAIVLFSEKEGQATKAQNFYEILGISKDATRAEIRSAYRKLALKYHPDKNPDNKEAEEKFKEVSLAYATLYDPEARKAYDAKIKNMEKA